MKVSVLKRIQALESKCIKSESPDLILVHYDSDIKKYVFREDYHNRNAKGDIAKGGHSDTVTVESYSDYVFGESVHAHVVVNFLNAPMGGNLYMFDTDSVRKKTACAAFSLGGVKHIEPLETEIQIIAYEKEVKQNDNKQYT